MFAGMLGAAAGKIMEYPFDTLKVRVQSAQMNPALSYNGPLDCLATTVRTEGALGLYKGMSTALLGACAETATLFAANGVIKRRIGGPDVKDEDMAMRDILLAGFAAGFVASFVLTPIEMVKVRMQSQTAVGSQLYRSPLDCLKQLVRGSGLSVLTRGFSATMAREVPGTAAWFGAYEYVLRKTTPDQHRRDVHPLIVVTAGAIGGMAYWLVPYPADTIKSAIQSGQSGGHHRFLPAFRHVYSHVGFRGLYAGISPTLMRAAPSNAAVFYVYGQVTQAMEDL